LLPYEIEELRIWLNSFIENKPELLICMTFIK
jgi:DNA replication protein DnaD